ncbi:MAG: TlpA family protein disulfide reductase [Thermoleophilaceae bacterium]
MKRNVVFAAVAAVLVALVVIGLLSARDSSSDKVRRPSEPAGPSLRQARAQLQGAPAPLAAVHAQSSQLLGGGAKAFAARLRELRGHPVVVNKWGSWCPPCRAEFPAFQRASARYGKKVAFLGVDGQDNARDARRFLARFPVSYPSYVDSDLGIARRLKAVQAFPSTVFYDSKGEVAYIKQGSYPDERALAADIRRYAR